MMTKRISGSLPQGDAVFTWVLSTFAQASSPPMMSSTAFFFSAICNNHGRVGVQIGKTIHAPCLG